jgi:4-carboxymuconolactone decarboxylase
MDANRSRRPGEPDQASSRAPRAGGAVRAVVATALSTMALHAASAAEPALEVFHAPTSQAQLAPAAHFTGNVAVQMLVAAAGPDRASCGAVTFAPGARTAWHTHPLGQTLIVTAGVGRVQRWGGPIQEVHVGDVVRIPPNTRHWHGAAPGSSMTHIAIQEASDGKTVDWLEPVTDAEYQPTGAAPAPPASRAQQLMGDVAPKLAQLTDDVLFGDVWARPGLSPRDRSLVTVSALIAMNRPDQLRSHMSLALRNGVTQDELVETLTHLAFYTGWPNAVTAVGVARDVFTNPEK